MPNGHSNAPRYTNPTFEELEELYREPTPAESLRDCIHRDACLGLLYMFTRMDCDVNDMNHLDKAARVMMCEDCGEWSD